MSTDSKAPDRDLEGRRLIVGLTGGIACYKVASVVSALVQDGADVTVAMTDAATRFVAPLTFEALSGRPVYTSQWEHVESHDPQHVALARQADLMLIAPCTMDMLAKLASGRCDDVVSLIAAAIEPARQPVVLAPSMNTVMWRQKSTQRNLARLVEDGFRVIAPGDGWQACRSVGPGRLAEPAQIVTQLKQSLSAR